MKVWNWEGFWSYFTNLYLLEGALWTIGLTVSTLFLGSLLGLALAVMRLSSRRWLSRIAQVYVWIFRGTPLLVQIFYVYFAFSWPTLNFGFWVVPDAAIAGIVALSINEGAYMREIIRAGIDSVDRGQMEAARSVGMTYGKAMRRIILPQAARVIVPPLGNEFNNMMKNTSLVYTIGVFEMFAYAEQNYSQFFIADYFLAIAIWYLVLTTVWTFIQAYIERRLSVSDRGDELSFRERLELAWNPMAAWARGTPHR